jgi:hypothetical protein
MSYSDEPVASMPQDADEPATWVPGPDVTDHTGDPLPPEMDFFAPPPAEIGEVRTARSSLKETTRPASPALQFLALFVPGFVAIAALQLAGVESVLVQGLVFLGLFLVGWRFTRFAHDCSYVGKDGIARFRCKGRRDRVTRREVFLFRDATELRTAQTRQYTNGVYTGTSYTFKWTDADGRKVYALSGTYRGEKKPPKPKDRFHFAASAEVAWSVFLLDHLQDELDASGMVRFNLGGSDFVGVGPGVLHLQLKGQTQSCPVEEIADITIAQGNFKVKRTDAKEGWFRSQGVFQFPYASLANARLFPFVIERLLGLHFS